MTNDELARRLRDHASGLARMGDNLYRVRAFRQAALAVSGLSEDVSVLVGRDGGKALEDIPGIGKSLARTIQAYVAELARQAARAESPAVQPREMSRNSTYSAMSSGWQ